MRLNAQKSWNSIAWTDPFLGAHAADTMSDSSSTFQFYDGKMASLLDVRDFELYGYSVFAARLTADDFFLDSEIDLHGNSSAEGLMWASLVVPVDIERNLPSDGILTQRNENASGAFVFYGAHQSFNNGDASVLANRAETLFNVPWFPIAPSSEIN